MSAEADAPVGVPVRDGIFNWVDEESYHLDRGSLSVSGAKLLLPPSCPAKFRHTMDNPPKVKREWDFGHVAHRLVLGKGAEFKALDPAVHGLKADGKPSEKPTSTTKWRNAAADARARGLVPIHADDHAKAQTMAVGVFKHPVAGRLFAEGDAEVALYHTDAETGVRLRGRCDWICHRDRDRMVIVDYKTSTTANPAELVRKFWSLGYFMQAAWYRDLAVSLGLSEDPRFLFVVQEKEAPHVVTVMEYDDDAITEGQRLNREAIRLYTQCRDRDEWPGYTVDTVTISLPGWAFPRPQTVGEYLADSYIYDVDPLSEEYA